MPTNPDLTTAPETFPANSDERQRERALGLALLWCSQDPGRVGAFMPIAKQGGHVFGRGGALASDSGIRVSLVQQRPGENLMLGPAENPALSRVQLELRANGSELDVRNVGKPSLVVNGIVVERATVRPGDLLQIGRQMLWLCVERPSVLEGERRPTQALGKADAHGIVGESESIWRLRDEIAFAAARPGHVLIRGPTGTGKELAARAVHALSCPTGAWIPRNAGTMPESLLDAELFGNPKGYPNPGVPERKGLIGAADGGSLFLDELAELPISAQTHLLRVLDSGEYQRLGETTVRRSQFRLIGATNRALSALRDDVRARFPFRIELHPLAERRDDIVLLARHQLRSMCAEDHTLSARFFRPDGEPRLSLELAAALTKHPLSENTRELKELLWQVVAQSQGDTLELPSSGLGRSVTTPPASSDARPARTSEPNVTATSLRQALDQHGGSLQKTWQGLGLSSRYALMRLMKKHGIKLHKRAAED